MLLSQAILLGSIDSLQGFGPEAMQGEKLCALGAALHAVNAKSKCFASVWRQWPFTTQPAPLCPACGDTHDIFVMDIMSLIWYLNDSHRWTRPQIAAWVATMEPKESGGCSTGHHSHEQEQVSTPAPCLTQS